MKTSFGSVFVLFALFVGVFSAPSSVKRQEAEVSTILTDLFSTIQQYTGAINSTAAGLDENSSDADKAAAADSFNSAITSITDAVTAATTQVTSIGATKRSLITRQSDQDLANLIVKLLLEVSGALNNILNTIGITPILGFLNPLVGSLSGLLLALDKLLDQVLILVRKIVDGLLIGLSLALAGLII